MKAGRNRITEKAEVVIKESDMGNNIGYPLKLPYLSVFVCLSGSAVVNVNFKNYLFRKNDLLIVSEDSITITKRTSSDFKSFCYLIERSLASEIAYNLPSQLFSFLWESPYLLLEDEELPLLNMWIGLLKHIEARNNEYQHLMFRNHFQNLFLYIAERMPKDEISKHKYSRKEVLCWKFWELIGKHSKQYRDVAFYARELCITPFYLSQLTKGFMNDSPKGLIDRQVILEMKALLDVTDLSIKEIAERLNFEDTSYMCRYFKRQTGISLTEYRK